MNGFIKNLLALATVVGMAFGAYTILTGKPEQIIRDNKADLEHKIEEERVRVLSYVDSKDTAKTAEIQAVNTNLNEKFNILMNKLDKMDDRLYDLQRDKSQNSARLLDEERDGG
jgi:hypothetical protein